MLQHGGFTQATPLYWESYAKLRRLPTLRSDRVAVIGGSADAHSSLRLKRAGSLDDVERVQALQGADSRAHCGIGDMQIASGGLQLRMAEQDLNGA